MLVTTATAALTSTGSMEAIENGINHFMEGSAVLMKALDELSKIHPFVSVVVLAFKAAWTLEINRRENDKRIIALYVEMRDMMSIIVQLKDIKDLEDKAPDGTTIKGRMQKLLGTVAKDIKSCANTCDTYLKKKTITKVINGPIWGERLLKFVNVFSNRRTEFTLALGINTARAVATANRKLDDIGQTTKETKEKMYLMTKMFEKLISLEERKLMSLMKEKGGRQVYQENPKILKELVDKLATPTKTGRVQVGASNQIKFEDVLEELHTDPDEAISNNMKVFDRKFDMQTQQIRALSDKIRQESDRVIKTINAGPHDRIIDPVLRVLTLPQKWQNSVKTRLFVLTLRDYFQEKWGEISQQQAAGDNPDEWALDYLNVIRLQPLTEAFDNDASGFITINEVNSFTESRPNDWSLPHWLAYWAIGWNQTLWDYKEKIHDTFQEMFALLPKAKAENRPGINNYLTKIYMTIETLAESVNPCYVPQALQERFRSYVETEETRLKSQLERIKYDIDDKDTLKLITEGGRIDRKTVLPLLYLLLKRHLDIFRVSCDNILHRDELEDAADTIVWIFNEVYVRVENLEAIFKQQKRDLNQEFKIFAHGLYKYYNDPVALWNTSRVHEMESIDYLYNDSVEKTDIKASEICNYPLDQPYIDYAAYDLPNAILQQEGSVSTHLDTILGAWNGYIYKQAGIFSGMISFTFIYKEYQSDVLYFEATGKNSESNFKISGKCTPEINRQVINISFTQEYPTRPSQEWTGKYNTESEEISGILKPDDVYSGPLTFLLKRTSPEILCFRPIPSLIQKSKYKGLWNYALSAVTAQIRRNLWSWKYFEERGNIRKRFMELYTHNLELGFGPGLGMQGSKLDEIKQQLTAADFRFYHSLVLHKRYTTVLHDCYCDNCGGSTGESRIICLVCRAKDTEPVNTVDLCDTPECVAASATRPDLMRSHLPTHDLIKVRRIVHFRQYGSMVKKAEAALKRARSLFGQYLETDKQGTRLLDSSNEQHRPTCGGCHKPVTQPCWYCVQCQGDYSTVSTCDSKGLVPFVKNYKGRHLYHTHDLVRCAPLVKDAEAPSVKSISSSLSAVDERVANLEQSMTALSSVINTRMAGIERLMKELLGKSNVGAPSMPSSLLPAGTNQLATPPSST
ncbi:hypothetical protein BU17DRAFT_56323 [Hysterangium stoloniferum]|nr:hypothetical protein BU17DRAFT_56323 [Hysterangium stoloniferum]